MARALYLFLFVFLFTSTNGYGQLKEERVRFFHLDAKSGLSQSSVFAILQDHLGFMWIGTRDGLNRYDAKKFTTYRNALSDRDVLSDNYITTLFEDKQKRLWVGTANGLNLFNRQKDKFEIIPVATDRNAMINGVTEDRRGNIWFSTSIGLYVLRKEATSTQLELVYNGYKPDGATAVHAGSRYVQQVMEDSQGRSWISTVGGVYVYQNLLNKKSSPPQHIFRAETGRLNCQDVRFVYEMKPGIYWFGTKEGGINVYDQRSDAFTYYGDGVAGKSTGLHSLDIRSMIADRFGGYWIGTINGLYYYAEDTGFLSFRKNEINPYSISDNSIRPIYQDHRGSIWLGTYYGGVNIFDRNIPFFRNHTKGTSKDGLSSNVISGIVQDQASNYWVGTEGGGLSYFSSHKELLYQYTSNPAIGTSLSTNHVKALYLDKNENLYIGTYNGGLNVLKKGSTSFQHYKHDPANPSSIANNNVYSFATDDANNLWIGTYGGGVSLQKNGESSFFERYNHRRKDGKQLSSDLVRIVFMDSRKNMWVGTDNGLNVKWKGKDGFEKFYYADDNPESISSNVIINIFEDSKGRLWVSTYKNGINEFNYATKAFHRIMPKSPNLSNDFYSIVEDNGLLWISNDKGLAAFNPEDGNIKRYNILDGLVGNEFSMHAAYKSKTGELLFGGTHGITAFWPKDIPTSSYIPKVVFTDFKVSNKSVPIDDDGTLKSHISNRPTLTLDYKQNMFSVDFATLNFIVPDKNRYAYKLEGFDSHWNYVSTPTATYTNLPAGNYTLLIKGASNDGVWSEHPQELKIVMLPPPWKTWWAYLIYTLLVGAAVYAVVRFTRSRAELKHLLKVKEMEAENKRKLAEVKASFFTNISHELRTPLTLILGPLDYILPSMEENNSLKPTLTTMHKNAQQLLQLVNELLDLRKNELGHTRLKVAEYAIDEFVREVLYSFKNQMALKGIVVETYCEEPHLKVWFDHVQLGKVFYNLIGNAVKYVPNNGHIQVNLSTTPSHVDGEKDKLYIEIRDNGIGIPEDEIQSVFELFYQADKQVGIKPSLGSGVGLALAKEIVQQHHGTIQVESRYSPQQIDSFTIFKIEIPLGNAHFTDEELVVNPKANTFYSTEQQNHQGQISHKDILAIETEVSAIVDDQELNSVLIVDDNEAIRDFLYQGLSRNYKVVVAADGEEALTFIEQQLPDMIISDVMMPNLDGVSLLKKVKENPISSHIPVLLLTALSSDQDMREGMYAGADDYLVKPINLELLSLKIQNILFTRKYYRKSFLQELVLKESGENDGAKGQDYTFLKKVVDFVEQNLAESELNVVRLSAEVGMSRPVVYRKIKQITGLSVIELINLIRMRHAVTLLNDSQLLVSEIAYHLGYSDPKYFSKSFKVFFGLSPSQFSALDQVAKVELMHSNSFFKLLKYVKEEVV